MTSSRPPGVKNDAKFTAAGGARWRRLWYTGGGSAVWKRGYGKVGNGTPR